MPTPEEANHAARAEANGQLGKIIEHIDELKTSQTENGELGDEVGHAGNEEEKLDRFRDEIRDEIDAIQALINHNQIGPADRRLREMVRRIGRIVSPAGKTLYGKIKDAARKFEVAKRGITEPAIPLDTVIGAREWADLDRRMARGPREQAVPLA
ncbi:hypothetical protein [Brevundimonas sp.]|uniref:hypothetical protein n=1 Tax=Brevundimonas sp. TaxID=1871086 RepID=UPI002FC84FBD